MTNPTPSTTSPQALAQMAQDKKKREAALTKAYTLATAELREKHLEEFNQLRVKHTDKLGFKWEPPLTEAQKAKASLEQILADHPELGSIYVEPEPDGVSDTPEQAEPDPSPQQD